MEKHLDNHRSVTQCKKYDEKTYKGKLSYEEKVESWGVTIWINRLEGK